MSFSDQASPCSLIRSQVFPATSQTAQRIKTAVLAVRDTASNSDDLKTMANMYSVALEAESRKSGRCEVPDLARIHASQAQAM
jgi:hypothetical protein